MASCKRCKAEIAWRKAPDASGKLTWIPHVPKRDEAGAIVFAVHGNGGGRQTRRAVASYERHVCGAPELAVTPQAPAVAPAVPEAGASPAVSLAPLEPATIEPIVRGIMVKVLDEYGVAPPPRQIAVSVNGGTPTVSAPGEIIHPKVERLISYVAAGVHAYVYGPAGSGKTFGALQAARLCGRESVLVSMPGVSYGKLFGFADAQGRTVRTAFAEALRDGRVVVLDEFDRALPAVAASLNSVLENRVFTVGEEVVEVSPLCSIIATGNTDMRGATAQYTSAQPIDAATIARFAFIRMDYDEAHEAEMIAQVLAPESAGRLLTWLRKVRAIIARDRTDSVHAGPREALRIAQDVCRGTSTADALETWVWRGLDEMTVRRIVGEIGSPAPEALRAK